jgi:hypothetical protein
MAGRLDRTPYTEMHDDDEKGYYCTTRVSAATDVRLAFLDFCSTDTIFFSTGVAVVGF